MTIGSQIAHHRKQRNLTQEALAQRLGVTNQAVSKWESGLACPDIQLLPELSDIFGISIDELFGRAPQAVPVQSALPWENDKKLRVVLYQGHTLLQSDPAAEKITFAYEGPALNIHSAFSISCGDVEGDVDAGANVECGNVGGNVDAGANVQCGDVDGNVDAGAMVNCGDVDGDVEAGFSVTCGDVGGDVDAGGTITIQK